MRRGCYNEEQYPAYAGSVHEAGFEHVMASKKQQKTCEHGAFTRILTFKELPKRLEKERKDCQDETREPSADEKFQLPIVAMACFLDPLT